MKLSSNSSSRLLTVLTEGQKKSLTKGPVDRSLFITCVGGEGASEDFQSISIAPSLYSVGDDLPPPAAAAPPPENRVIENPPSSHFQRKYGFVTHISACLHVSVTHGTELSSAAPGSAGYHL